MSALLFKEFGGDSIEDLLNLDWGVWGQNTYIWQYYYFILVTKNQLEVSLCPMLIDITDWYLLSCSCNILRQAFIIEFKQQVSCWETEETILALICSKFFNHSFCSSLTSSHLIQVWSPQFMEIYVIVQVMMGKSAIGVFEVAAGLMESVAPTGKGREQMSHP